MSRRLSQARTIVNNGRAIGLIVHVARGETPLASSSIAAFPSINRASNRARLLVTVLILAVFAGASAEAASVSVTWNAPTTNADGTRLTDLAGYRLYLGTAAPACPSDAYHAVSSADTTPASGETVSADVTALSAGATYFARITAVDFAGNESSCSSAASGVARPDFTVAPSATISFGSVAISGILDRTFTVQNTSSVDISGAASVAAPFGIVSGGSFSLAPGDSQTVTVRFQPTTLGNFAGNVTFVAGDDSISRGVSGSATGGSTAPPPPPTPPDMAGSPNVTQLSADATGVTFAVSWAAASGASSYGYVAAFGDGTGAQQGAVTAPSVQLRMPYHVSGAAATGFVCIRSVGATGVQSAEQSCGPLPVPARSATTPVPSVPSVPVASSLSPTGAVAGSAALTLTVNGSGFVASSGVRWNGAARTTTFVNASQLRAAISAADLATARAVPVSVVTPAPGGGTSGTVTFTITAAPAPPPPTPPPAPGALSVTRTATDASGATFTISWTAVGGATSYAWAAAFNDASAPQQGTVTTRSFQLRMPYHASGAAFGAQVCVRSVGTTGLQSTTQSCGAVPVPARPVAPPPPPPPPAQPLPPPPAPPEYGWGVG